MPSSCIGRPQSTLTVPTLQPFPPTHTGSAPDTTAVPPEQLLRLADQCVKCGLCLPHCPTFGKLENEADSPRGRIALIQGWASGQLPMSATLAAHLDGCLTCRACEAMCPSLVAFGRLADGAKAERTARLPRWRRRFRSGWLSALSSARITAGLGSLSALYRETGAARLTELIGLAGWKRVRPYHRIATVLGAPPRRIEPRSPERPDVELFAGCMGAAAQGPALQATLQVLDRVGLRAIVADRPACCGAMLRHNGLPAEAEQRRAACFRPDSRVPLVGLASACLAELREGRPGSAGVLEICELLERGPLMSALELRPLHLRVLVHEPCSHRNLLGGNAAVHRLLSRIPGLDVEALPGNGRCCGAAGTYMIQQPAMAESLLADKLEAIVAAAPDILVTTNPGCALHLAAGIREAGLRVEVCHPVELIARQIRDPDPER